MIDFPITIRPAEAAELDLLEQTFNPHDKSLYHHQRFEKQQNGEGVYLIAWHNDIPVGHFLLEWSHPESEEVKQIVDLHKRAHLLAGGTREEYRRKGVATKLIQEAERLAKEHGCEWIGLEVGSSDNPDAKRLYEKLGYKDSGIGAFTISWDYIDKNGKKRKEYEEVIYMEKKL